MGSSKVSLPTMDQKIRQGPSKGTIQKFNCELWPQKSLKAPVKGTFENFAVNYGPNIFENPRGKDIRKLDCQLFLKAQARIEQNSKT